MLEKYTRDGYGKALLELGGENEDVVVLDADLADSTRTAWFGKQFSERFFNCGIAEENLIAIAAGLATCGKIPFVSTFSVFATEVAYNQIRQTVAFPNLNVKIVVSHGGVTIGADGTSHQTTTDIAIMRVLPNMTVIVPSDIIETMIAVKAIANFKGPVYMRLGRPKVPVIFEENYKYQGKSLNFKIGKAVKLREGSDITILATGILVYEALTAAEKLSAVGIEAQVLNVHTIKPLDKKAIAKAVKETGGIVTAEEHSIIGGLGGAVAEVLVQSDDLVPVEMIGVRDVFGESGSPLDLMKLYGLTADNIVNAAHRVFKRKK